MFLVLSAPLALPAAADDRQPPTVIEDHSFTAEHDGTTQRYVTITPTDLTTQQPVRLLIALHGHGSDRWQFVRQPRDECRATRDVALAHRLILVSPDYRAATSWMGPAAEADLLQIIRELKSEWSVDSIILCGGSMGGTGALTFTALHPDLINGVVSLNGTANLVEYERFQQAIAESFGGTRQDVPEQYRRRSAEFFPDHFQMPFAATTGGQDTVVPAASVLRLVNAVQTNHSQVLSIHRPEGGHSTSYADTKRALEFVLAAATSVPEPAPTQDIVRAHLKIITPLTYTNTPMDPQIDLGMLAKESGVSGIPDLNSIVVRNITSNQVVPHALSDDFQTGDSGRIEFVVADPQHTDFELQFSMAAERGPPTTADRIPQIGTGDLLRYNAGVPRPVCVPYSPGLHDLNGDGRPDLTGSWNYARRPGRPWDGIVCFPRTDADDFQFTNLHRLQFRSDEHAAPRPISHIYMGCDFADFNGDGRPDVVMTRRSTGSAEIFLNAGEPDTGGLPDFVAAAQVSIAGWQACQAVDLDSDGALDLVVDGQYVRNSNPSGWPFHATPPRPLNAGRKPCFLDIDGDNRPDAVCLHGGDTVQPDFYQIAWRRNLGEDPPRFSKEQIIDEIRLPDISCVTEWDHAGRSGLIVQHRAFQELSFFELAPPTSADEPRATLRPLGRAESHSAVLCLSDQAWPNLCDWDADGDMDLLAGGGYGWPRIVKNHGTRTEPAFGEPERLLADGEPIRFLRNEILGDPPNGHNMGYPYPVFADWDNDGFRDLICPNETNRLYWFKNVGTQDSPRFAPRRQILCDGYPDSAEQRSRSNLRANDPRSSNGVYPYEEERPFFWRTGAAIADFNSDGLTDIITHDGHKRVATLFTQYRDDGGQLRLRRDRELTLADGRRINDAIVQRRAHWTESFRAVDWNQDGLQDLIYSVAGAHSGTQDDGSIYLLRNVGTATDPVFASPQTMRCFGEPIRITNHGPHPWPGDFDGDGLPDLIACVEWSVYPWYSHAALMMKERPKYTIDLIPEAP